MGSPRRDRLRCRIRRRSKRRGQELALGPNLEALCLGDVQQPQACNPTTPSHPACCRWPVSRGRCRFPEDIPDEVQRRSQTQVSQRVVDTQHSWPDRKTAIRARSR
ncbi:hypothetical protein GGTG_07008 [Gaeumannomyces tritici R3-111a-1]|uniref:Uncharacterized protein n=1 Tax=Gaeumannomyces tritici (strain R3-111a-1) TaxID=644352 RepID=J3P0G2_GAET3|nr:hypothetical protein GGTG_07008 [Gaeumannomyces tritici R3-111a-1]EJT77095.1 hypothetical protein GGTG_07008 [Gaeumannomyces tritici R3-111a-1]